METSSIRVLKQERDILHSYSTRVLHPQTVCRVFTMLSPVRLRIFSAAIKPWRDSWWIVRRVGIHTVCLSSWAWRRLWASRRKISVRRFLSLSITPLAVRTWWSSRKSGRIWRRRWVIGWIWRIRISRMITAISRPCGIYWKSFIRKVFYIKAIRSNRILPPRVRAWARTSWTNQAVIVTWRIRLVRHSSIYWTRNRRWHNSAILISWHGQRLLGRCLPIRRFA